MKTLVLAHAVATLFMLGVIAVVQIVHYPLFARVGAEGFATYQHEHARLITWVVMPPMVVELLTALALAVEAPPAVPRWMPMAGLALVVIIWGSTALIQVPAHSALSGGFDEGAHARLVATNWIRTVAWFIRSGLVVAMLERLLAGPTAS